MADIDQMATDYITSNGKILFKSYFVSKIVLTFCEKKNCSSDQEMFLKFEAEGLEFAKILRSLEQLILTVNG